MTQSVQMLPPQNVNDSDQQSDHENDQSSLQEETVHQIVLVIGIQFAGNKGLGVSRAIPENGRHIRCCYW